MTIVNPIVTPTNLSGFPAGLHNYTNITPFTYRDGMSFLEKVESLQNWLYTILVPHIDGEMSSFETAWNDEVTSLIATVNTALTTQADEVNTAISTETASNDQKIADLTTWVSEQIATIVQNSLEANDGVVQGLVNNTNSLARAALDAVYQKKGTVDDTAVSHLLDTDTATREAFDGRYFKASGATLDVPHGGTGRTSDTPNALIAGGTASDTAQVSISPSTAGYFLKSGGPDSLPSFVELINDNAPNAGKTYSSTKIEALVASKAIYDTFANRPAIASVKDGTIFACSDLPEQYIAQGGVWRVIGSGGNELGYAEINAQTVTTAGAGTTPVPIVGLATTFKVGVRPIRVLFCADVANELANSRTLIDILLDGVKAYTILVPSPSTAPMWVTGSGSVRLPAAIGGTALVPGSTHTISTQVYCDTTAGRAHVTGNPGSPGNLQVVTA